MPSVALLAFVCASLQEAYGMLQSYYVPVAKEESDHVDSLRYSVEKLLSQAV